jgi:hypothetical protein
MEYLKALACLLVGLVLWVFLIKLAMDHSPAVKAEDAWHQECRDRGGEFIPRTTVCIKREVIIEQIQIL